MQRIFKYGDIQNIILIPDKQLNILYIYIECLPMSLYKRVMQFKSYTAVTCVGNVNYDTPCRYVVLACRQRWFLTLLFYCYALYHILIAFCFALNVVL